MLNKFGHTAMMTWAHAFQRPDASRSLHLERVALGKLSHLRFVQTGFPTGSHRLIPCAPSLDHAIFVFWLIKLATIRLNAPRQTGCGFHSRFSSLESTGEFLHHTK